MEIEEYLAQKEKRLEKGKERVKDLRVFDFNYLPEKPLMREEAKPVIDALLRYQKTGIANHLVLLGSRGCGKLSKPEQQLQDPRLDSGSEATRSEPC